MLTTGVDDLLRKFGRAVYTKLNAALGEPEEQLRAPFENLFGELADRAGVSVTIVGEAQLSEERTRPDYAVTVGPNPLPVGFIELKSPGIGSDAEQFKKGHNKDQWERLRALPNLIYCDGNSWALYRSGEKVRVARLEGDLLVGPGLTDPKENLLRLVTDFLEWQPKPPTSAAELVSRVAGLCRLLRAEVEELVVTSPSLKALADDWRHLLFPEATDAQFADGYAQAVTFALLLARAEGIDFSDQSITEISHRLGKKHSLMGRALDVLTDDALLGSLATSVKTLQRVCSVVQWDRLADRGQEPWLRFYEDFLAEYDPELRKQTGSYYTPNQVVEAMVRMADDLLRHRLGLEGGFASPSVVTVDPAMGTGTFLLHVVRRVAEWIAGEEGAGAVPPRIKALTERLIGFERQLGPYTVAELRTFEEFREKKANVPADALRLYVADTLDDPYIEVTHLGGFYEPIAKSRNAANTVKREERVMVVIGNPPYRDKAAGLGGWVEKGDPKASTPPLLEDFVPPASWGVGVHVKHLYNLYLFFWRWALWKVFEAHEDAPAGVVSFITSAGFLDAPGLAAVRQHMRAIADQIWVIDVSPEGNQPPVPTRVFPGVQRPLCITFVLRTSAADPGVPAVVRHLTVEGSRADKFKRLSTLTFDDPEWQACPSGWTDPFTPGSSVSWSALPSVGDLLPWSSPGISAHRTWPSAPERDVLCARWDRIVAAGGAEKWSLFMKARDTDPDRKRQALPGHPHSGTFADEKGPCPEPVRYAITSLDRQWLLPDARLINDPRPPLWQSLSSRQVFVSELHTEALRGGPALTFTANIPSLHHFKGSEGGRILPTWRDAGATSPNVAPGLLDYLSGLLGSVVQVDDLVAYVAGVVSHSGYTERFKADLSIPGVRVPLTGAPTLWGEAVDIGSEVIWLYTYGARYVKPTAGRSMGAPRLPNGQRPKVISAIPDDESSMPEEASWDSATETLHVGTGAIRPVPASTWEFEVSGFKVVQRWIKRRVREPEGTRRSALDDINANRWTTEFTTQLLDLLNVVGRLVSLEPKQADLLDRILAGPLLTVAELTAADVLPVPARARKTPTQPKTGDNALF